MIHINKWRILPIILLIFTTLFITPAGAEGSTLPTVEGDLPTIDGLFNSTEWEESINFNTTLGGFDQVKVTSDENNLFIGFNYSAPPVIPVNNTAYNSTTNLNLQNHDWFAIQFDNNLDETEFGSTDSPDDAVVFNQYNDSIYDSFIDGNETHPFKIDTLNNGTNDVSAIVANYTDTYNFEVNKTYSLDEEGGDIANRRSIFQFRLMVYTNQTSNSTTFANTEWFTFRLNETGTGVALKEADEFPINIHILGDENNNFQALNTVANEYGINATISSGNVTYAEDTLFVLVINSEYELLDSQLSDLISYAELGGTVAIFMDKGSAATKISDAFDISYLEEDLTLADNSTDLTISSSALSGMFLEGDNLVTSRAIADLSLNSGVFNISDVQDENNQFVLRQDYMMNSLIDISQFNYQTNATTSDMAAAVSFDFLKGGRVSLFASTSMLNNNHLTAADNLHYFLKLLPWNARITNTLMVNSVELNTHAVNKTEPIVVTVNATDGFGNSVDGLNVEAELLLANVLTDSLMLTGTDDVYTGELQTLESGSQQVKVTIYLEGYGFAEGEIQQVFVETPISNFNDPADTNIILFIVFVISAIIGVMVYLQKNKLQ